MTFWRDLADRGPSTDRPGPQRVLWANGARLACERLGLLCQRTCNLVISAIHHFHRPSKLSRVVIRTERVFSGDRFFL